MLRNVRDIALLVLLAVAIGLVGSRVAPARSGPTPTPAPTVTVEPSPTPTPEPTDDARVWDQPLSAGCATESGQVFLFSSGGGIARFDGKVWGLVDDTLRQMRAALCLPGLVIAVGDGGKIVRIDPALRTVRPDTIGNDDLLGVGALDAREIVAGGADLTVMRLHEGSWTKIGGGGVGLNWRAVLVRSATEVWLAGDAGTLFVFDGTKFADRSIPDGPDLTALAPLGSITLIGASDGRLFSAAPGRAARPFAKVTGAVRGMAADAEGVFVLADGLSHVTTSAPVAALPYDLGCPAVGIFGAPGGEIWLIGRQGSRSGTARYDGTSWIKAGRC